MFSHLITQHWFPFPESLEETSENLRIIIDPALADTVSLSTLELTSGQGFIFMTPEKARLLELPTEGELDRETFAQALAGAEIKLNDADNIFYFPEAAQHRLAAEQASDTRRLTIADQVEFDNFIAHAPVDDVDEAYVELDHWLVYGTFTNGVVGSVASMYPWVGSKLADLGVITLPKYRGQGLARKTVQAMSAEALGLGYEPQYRCQLDNTASVALAMAAGFKLFGRWEVIVGEN